MSTMSTIGATKAQITKTVNTLRKALGEAECQLAPAPNGSRVSPGESTGNECEFNTTHSIFKHYHAQYIRSFLKRLEDRWDGAHALAEAHRGQLSEAIKILTNTYLRSEPLRNKLQRQLEAVLPAHRSPLSQGTTLCTLKSLWLQLERLGEHPASTTHMRAIRTKFSNNIRDKVGEMRSTGDNWDVNTLLFALDKVIDRLEVMEDNHPERIHARLDNTAHAPPSGRSVDARRPPSTAQLGETVRQTEGEHDGAPSVFVVNTNLISALEYNPTTAGEK
ncbi:unnamed protein product [Heligmosomoides polygyrus]|uniref:Uncharacterized protein n=1 Tax=Heligmosomoides polygyrus TaxID=6339 RepID=A0A3P7VBJ3_HELPZ|nr:unnamed protein product [Heligmosomoides polygyrus]